MFFSRRQEKSLVLVEEPPLPEIKEPGWFRRNWLRLMLGAAALAALTVLAVLVLRPFLTPVETPLDKARTLLNDGHYTELVQELRKYVINNPDDYKTDQGYQVRLYLVQGLLALLQPQPASGYLKEMLNVRPNDPAANFWQGKTQFLDQTYDLAAQTWQNPAVTGSKDYKGRALLGMAEIYFAQNRFEESRRYLQDAFLAGGSLDPVEAHRLNYLYGLMLLRDTTFDAARQQFAKAAPIKPLSQNNGPVYWAIYQENERIRSITSALPGDDNSQPETARRTKAGYALLLGDEYGLAEEQFVRVLQLTPNFINAQAYLASIYWRTGRVLQAQATLYTVLKADPSNRFARQVFIQLLTEQLQKASPAANSASQIQQARDYVDKLLQDLIKERPDDAILRIDMARFQTILGQYQKAEEAYIKALELNDKNPVPGLNVSLLLLQFYTDIGVDPCQRGALFADRVLKEVPDQPESWYWAGTSSLFCGKANLAITQFQKALELKPYWPLAVNRLGLAYQDRGDPDIANTYFDLATDITPATRWNRKN